MSTQGESHPFVHSWQSWFFIAVAVLVVACTLGSISPPAPKGLETDPHEFSAARAIEWLRPLTESHRPLGTPGHEAAKQRLIEEFRRMGVDFDIQNAVTSNQFAGWHKGASLSNVVGRIRGRDSTGAIALVAHYDSVANSRGASDDGSGVAAIIETARALQLGEKLRNDVILLFTDAEEIGTIGASAFAFDHPWAEDVKMLFNFEARGSRGPSAMFETSVNNGWIIEGFAESAPRPIGNSFISSMAKILPNDTDFTVFRKAGMVGLNFAYADGLHHYHSHADDLERLDAGSLQHHGDYALALTKHFGNLDLKRPHEPSVVYFDLFGRSLVHYGFVWNWIVLFVLLVGLSFLVSFRLPFVRVGGLLAGAALFPASILVGILMSSLTTAFLLMLKPTVLVVAWSPYFFVSILLMVVGVLGWLFARLRRWISDEAIFFGSLLWWALFAALTTWALPGMAYLFQLPVLFAVAGFALLRWGWNDGGKKAFVFAIAAWAGLLFLGAHTTSTTRMLDGGLTPAIPILFFLMFWLLGRGAFAVISPRWGLRLSKSALLAGVAMIPVGLWLADFSEHEPKPTSVFYALDHAEGKAYWISQSSRSDEWVEQYVPKDAKELVLPSLFVHGRAVRATEAPLLDWRAPEIKLVTDQSDEAFRSIELEIRSPRNAACFTIWEESETLVTQVLVNGREPHVFSRFSADFDKKMFRFLSGDQSRTDWRMVFCGLKDEALRLHLTAAPNSKFVLRIVETTYGLPEELVQGKKPRAPWMIPAQQSDLAISGAVYEF